MPSNGHLPFGALDRSRSKRGPFSHPYPGSGGWSGSRGETMGISRNAVVASGETGSRRGSEWWGILKVSDPRRVTVETDDALRRITAGRPAGIDIDSVSELELLRGKGGGSGVKRAWWRYSAAIEGEDDGDRRKERWVCGLITPRLTRFYKIVGHHQLGEPSSPGQMRRACCRRLQLLRPDNYPIPFSDAGRSASHSVKPVQHPRYALSSH